MSIATHKNFNLAAACALLLSAAGAARSNEASEQWMSKPWTPIVDARLRYEGVDQEPFAENAEAVTARLRFGIESPKFFNTTVLAEGEFVTPIVNDYNPTVPARGAYPVVADPESYELNRAQITNTSLDKTTITLGRQRINIDDQRFVGAVGWRQNEQTFDALRVVNKSVSKLTLDFTYINRVNRVFGHRSPQGVYKGDSFLGNVGYDTPVGKLTGFAYFIDIENIPGVAAAVRDSNSTYGLRFAGSHPFGGLKLGYVASYAMQKDYKDNPLSFDNDYYLGELTLSYSQFSGALGYEVLEGNGVKGFTTPLATLHKFQGWADKFLATPANGLKDTYASLMWSTKKVGPFSAMSASATYHDFKSERLTASAGGDEIDLQLLAKWDRVTAILKYADYNADGLFTDTQKVWVEFDYVW